MHYTAVKYKLKKLSNSTNISNAMALRCNNDLVLSLQWLMLSYALSSRKKIFKYCENQHHLHVCQAISDSTGKPKINLLGTLSFDSMYYFFYQCKLSICFLRNKQTISNICKFVNVNFLQFLCKTM